MILASVDEMTVGKLAEMADRIMDVATPTVTAMNTSTDDYHTCKVISEEFNTALQVQHRSHPRSFSKTIGKVRYHSRRRSTSRGRSRTLCIRQANQDDVCWYHVQFGENA